MTPFRTMNDHLTRRSLLKGIVGTAAGAALAGGGGLCNPQTIAQEAQRQGKRCILLWMAGGPSHIDTFDMKPEASADARRKFHALATSGARLPIHGACLRL